MNVGTGGVFDVKRSLIATVLFLVAAPLAAAAQQTGQGEKACCRYDQTATPGDSSFFNTFIWIINEDFPFYLSALPSDYFTFGGITIFSEDQVGGVTSQESTDGGIATVIALTTVNLEEFTIDLLGFTNTRREVIEHSVVGHCRTGGECEELLTDHRVWAEVEVKAKYRLQVSATLTNLPGSSNAKVWTTAYSALSLSGTGCNAAVAKKLKISVRDDEQPSYSVSAGGQFSATGPSGGLSGGTTIPLGPWNPIEVDYDFVELKSICIMNHKLVLEAENRTKSWAALNDYAALLKSTVSCDAWSVTILDECHNGHR